MQKRKNSKRKKDKSSAELKKLKSVSLSSKTSSVKTKSFYVILLFSKITRKYKPFKQKMMRSIKRWNHFLRNGKIYQMHKECPNGCSFFKVRIFIHNDTHNNFLIILKYFKVIHFIHSILITYPHKRSHLYTFSSF